MKHILGYSFAGLLLLIALLTSIVSGFLFERYDSIVLTLSGRYVLFTGAVVSSAVLIGLIVYRYWKQWRNIIGFSFVIVLLMFASFCVGWGLSDISGRDHTAGLHGWFYRIGLFEEITQLCIATEDHHCWNHVSDNAHRVSRDDVRWDGPARRFHSWLSELWPFSESYFRALR